MEKGLISIIVAVYNAEEYIVRCVDSILGQTYKNIELLLIDDGSTDKSGQICDEYKESDSRVRVIHKTNGGLADARNIGIQNAKGEYIGFVDDDDYIKDYMYEKLIHVMNSQDVDMVVCNYTYVDDIGRSLDVYSPISWDEVVSQREYFSRLTCPSYGYFITVWNRLYRSVVLKDIVFPVGKTNEDNYVLHRIIDACRRIAIVKDNLCFYTQREDSLSRNPNTKQYFDEINSVLDRIEFYKEKGYNDLIPENISLVIDIFLRVWRRFVFHDKKTVDNILMARKTRKDLIKTARNNKSSFSKKKYYSLMFVDFYTLICILSERISKIGKSV